MTNTRSATKRLRDDTGFKEKPRKTGRRPAHIVYTDSDDDDVHVMPEDAIVLVTVNSEEGSARTTEETPCNPPVSDRGKNKVSGETEATMHDNRRVKTRETFLDDSKDSGVCLASNSLKLQQVTRKLTNEQKAAISRSGFGGLVQMDLKDNPPGMAHWLLDAFDPDTMQVKRGDTELFKITEEDVRHIFGLPYCPGTPVKVGSDDMVKSIRLNWERVYAMPSRALPKTQLTAVRDALLAYDGVGDDLIRLFILYAMSTFLVPVASGTVSFTTLQSTTDIDSIGKHDWCSYVLAKTVVATKRYKVGGHFTYSGCYLLLMLCYMRKVHCIGHPASSSIPFVTDYSFEALERRIDYERRTGGFGKAQVYDKNADSDTAPSSNKSDTEDGKSSDNQISFSLSNPYPKQLAKLIRDVDVVLGDRFRELQHVKPDELYSNIPSHVYKSFPWILSSIERAIHILQQTKDVIQKQCSRMNPTVSTPDKTVGTNTEGFKDQEHAQMHDVHHTEEGDHQDYTVPQPHPNHDMESDMNQKGIEGQDFNAHPDGDIDQLVNPKQQLNESLAKHSDVAMNDVEKELSPTRIQGHTRDSSYEEGQPVQLVNSFKGVEDKQTSPSSTKETDRKEKDSLQVEFPIIPFLGKKEYSAPVGTESTTPALHDMVLDTQMKAQEHLKNSVKSATEFNLICSTNQDPIWQQLPSQELKDLESKCIFPQPQPELQKQPVSIAGTKLSSFDEVSSNYAHNSHGDCKDEISVTKSAPLENTPQTNTNSLAMTCVSGEGDSWQTLPPNFQKIHCSDIVRRLSGDPKCFLEPYKLEVADICIAGVCMDTKSKFEPYNDGVELLDWEEFKGFESKNKPSPHILNAWSRFLNGQQTDLTHATHIYLNVIPSYNWEKDNVAIDENWNIGMRACNRNITSAEMIFAPICFVKGDKLVGHYALLLLNFRKRQLQFLDSQVHKNVDKWNDAATKIREALSVWLDKCKHPQGLAVRNFELVCVSGEWRAGSKKHNAAIYVMYLMRNYSGDTTALPSMPIVQMGSSVMEKLRVCYCCHLVLNTLNKNRNKLKSLVAYHITFKQYEQIVEDEST